MIYGKISELGQYLGIHPNLDAAIRYVTDPKRDITLLKPGRTEVDGDQVFAVCADYTTEPQEQLTFETHIVYADIHIMRRGTEYIGVAPADSLQEMERCEENDYIGYQGKVSCLAKLDTESFIIVLPGEPHKVHIMDGSPLPVQKTVIKIKMQ